MTTGTPPAPRLPCITLAVFAVAMAFLESAVVVYLRELFHPDGFRFPLQPIDTRLAITELGREAATVVMIGGVARLAGGGLRDQFAAFAYVFGVWDIFYYAWLKVLIGWPEGLFDPDILFLLPAPWVGPVLAPMLVALALIALAFALRPRAAPPPRLGLLDGGLLLGGAALILWTFLEPNVGTAALDKPVIYPARYDWWLFGAGLASGVCAVARLRRRSRRLASTPTLILPDPGDPPLQ